MFGTFSLSDAENIVFLVTCALACVWWFAKRAGWLGERQPPIEARAEQMWRSEAEAQQQRADRLSIELGELRGKVDQMQNEMNSLNSALHELRAENRMLKERPDFGKLMSQFSLYHKEVMETSEKVLVALEKIAER